MKNNLIRNILFIVVFVFLTNCTQENIKMQNEAKEKDLIKEVIEEAYVEGIHRTQNINLIKKGFHKDFNMLVLKGNNIDKVDVNEWMNRLEKMITDNPKLWNEETTNRYELVDVSDYSAVAKLELYKGSVHFSTDYMLLYKIDEGWQIVSKIFSIPTK